MVTVYGPNGQTRRVLKSSVEGWLKKNPNWSLTPPENTLIEDDEKIEESIDDTEELDENTGAGELFPEISEEDFLSSFDDLEAGIYYGGIPTLLPNPQYVEGGTATEYVPTQSLYPDGNWIPTYESFTYFNNPKWNSVNIATYQDLLEDAGYLTGDYNPGENDLTTQKAVSKWFADYNFALLSGFQSGNNLNMEPEKFLGEQVNNRYKKLTQEIEFESADFAASFDRGKFLRTNFDSLIGRNPTDAELKHYQKIANEYIDKEIKANKERALYKLKQEFGKDVSSQLAEGEAKLFEEAGLNTGEPEQFDSSQAFIDMLSDDYKTYIERPERFDRARLNFDNVNRSILGGSMRIL